MKKLSNKKLHGAFIDRKVCRKKQQARPVPPLMFINPLVSYNK